MPVSPSAVGMVLSPTTMDIERGRLAAFARATGATDPAYFSVEAARAAGHRDIPVPPTFLFAIELENPDPFAWVREIGVNMNYVLHGAQHFDYHRVAYAGEQLTASPQLVDVYAKKGGALEFIVKKTAITDSSGAPVADLTSTIVVRNP